MIDRLISEFLLYGYCYYELGESLITDLKYDEISRQLLENYDDVLKSNHIHAYLITEEMLSTSSCNSVLSGKYPNSIKVCANQMVIEFENKHKTTMNDLF